MSSPGSVAVGGGEHDRQVEGDQGSAGRSVVRSDRTRIEQEEELRRRREAKAAEREKETDVQFVFFFAPAAQPSSCFVATFQM